ncbi:OmpA family protein [Vibrio atlanticus]|uniref:Outer membrane protein A n=1 Tax=Vibrio atlanticus TaxID=693153 RepID=A0A1C3ITJ5_9VIBR|nr:OmpA family protein [Vibrio atlanticus]SBS64764.1 Outer membrane protein A precursor [Vibrio atlanticus]
MKKLSKIMCAVIAASGFAAAPSIAATTYVGAKVGMGWLDSACVDNVDCEDDSVAGGVYGGYNFTDNIALELNADYLGDYDTSFNNNGATQRYSDSIVAISLSPMYRLAIKQEFDIFFKAGPAYIMHDDEDDVVLSLGIGAEKQFAEDWALRVEYQYFDDFDDKFVQDLNSNLVTVGLSYNFGTGNTTASAAAASAAVITQAPAEPIAEPEVIVVEEEVVVTKAKTESFSQGMFETNSTELSSEGKSALMPLVEVLQAHPQSSVNVVGHTDSTGAAEYNMMISKKRAAAVAAYIEEQGIAADRIAASGEGEENPVASNATAEGRAQNRRVDATIPSFEYQEKAQMEEVIVETAE